MAIPGGVIEEAGVIYPNSGYDTLSPFLGDIVPLRGVDSGSIVKVRIVWQFIPVKVY